MKDILDCLGDVATIVAAVSFVFAFFEFKSWNWERKNALSAVCFRSGPDKKIVLFNDSKHPMQKVQLKVRGCWKSNSPDASIVLPHPYKPKEARNNPDHWFCNWANIMPGNWEITPQASAFPVKWTNCDMTPIYDDHGFGVFWVEELVYTDINGKRWKRAASRENRLVLDEAKPVAKDYNI
ncbi:hypothetical protein [Bifidobacterium sp. ESL0704]|uniref:hypothetical protein n=1 Tax=Bifidobacterium sp. ESL0704 TaxID=2983219 RepID=UPI0023FA0C70|nr:hypothetical protein [Bifidobacterium sp. ESL0704]WEV52962.1 hypothetical protein OZX64_00150 [Bifidobacterium sp. ESL0704]